MRYSELVTYNYFSGGVDNVTTTHLYASALNLGKRNGIVVTEVKLKELKIIISGVVFMHATNTYI